MFSFLYQILFHVIHSRKKYYANIYITYLEVSFIFTTAKKLFKWRTRNFVYSCKQIAECKFFCANSKLVLVTDLYKYERSYCGKNGEIFIS